MVSRRTKVLLTTESWMASAGMKATMGHVGQDSPEAAARLLSEGL